MKTISDNRRIATVLACCACAAALPISAFAQNTRGADSKSPRSTSAQAGNKTMDTETVRVTRASNYLGTDVIATDGKKVGDIVDYYFDIGSAPHLAYVVIMTGGFLDMGGDRRAVPASAVTVSGDNCRINIASQQFWDVPVLPENRQRFLSDPQHRQRISQLFSQSARTADTSATTGSERTAAADQRTTTAGSTTTTTSGTDDPNRPGAMTGRPSGQGEGRLVSFNELRNADVYGQKDSRLGYFADAWISLNDNRAPYIEITPTFQPFRTNYDRRYAIPTAKLAQKREYYGYTMNVTTDELYNAEPVSETEGVKMLQEGRFGNTVLRVTVPEK